MFRLSSPPLGRVSTSALACVATVSFVILSPLGTTGAAAKEQRRDSNSLKSRGRETADQRDAKETSGLAREMRRIGLDRSPTAMVDGKRRGLDVDIAIIDTGIADHRDLNIAGGVNCSASPGSFNDNFGHGTWLAGVAAARDNGKGMVGVAPGARLWSLRVIDDTGGADVADVVCALDWVADHSNVIDVVVFGIGDVGADDLNCGRANGDALHKAVCRVYRAGVTMVAAAGNGSTDAATEVPATYDEVITVSTMSDTDGRPGGLGQPGCEGDPDDVLAPFSNFGPDVDLAAPGICIRTTTLNNKYTVATSASLSAAMVGGAAALYRLRYPRATPEQVRTGLIARGEPGPLSGDLDGSFEPILNVRGL